MYSIRWLCCLALALPPGGAAAAEKERRFELRLQVLPEGLASVSVHGSKTPFSFSGRTDFSGRMRVRGLRAGPYTVSAVGRDGAEARRTVQVSPSLADSRGRIEVTLETSHPETGLSEASRRRALVSARELSIPDRARREYDEAQRRLGERDVPGAVKRLKRAVEIAPRFVAAWNNLGTIAYQSRQFEQAAEYFGEALKHDPEAYEPLVNLGGTLLSLGRPRDALALNRKAVEMRPGDALANVQLGMNHLRLGDLGPAEKFLREAKQLDPAHFSNPQLLLAEVYARRGEAPAAAAELEEFLRLHPDWPEKDRLRQAIQELRAGPR